MRAFIAETARARFALVIMLTAFSIGTLGFTPSSAASELPIEINAILPLTGNLAFIGQNEQKALRVLEERVNGQRGIGKRPVHFVVADDGSNPVTAVQLASALISKKVNVILDGGPVSTCRATSALVKNGPLLYCLSPAFSPTKGSFTFSTSVDFRDLVAASARFVQTQNWTRIAVLSLTDATGQEGDVNLNAALALPGNSALRIVAQEHFSASDLSVAAQLARIHNADPQVLFMFTAGATTNTALRSLRDAGFSLPVVTTLANMTYAQMDSYVGYIPKDIYFSAPRWAAYSVIRGGPVKDALRTYYGLLANAKVPADAGTSVAWDPALIVIDALRHKGAEAEPAELRDYISGLRGFAGINGYYDFINEPQRGLSISDTVIARWNQSKRTWEPVTGPGGAPR